MMPMVLPWDSGFADLCFLLASVVDSGSDDVPVVDSDFGFVDLCLHRFLRDSLVDLGFGFADLYFHRFHRDSVAGSGSDGVRPVDWGDVLLEGCGLDLRLVVDGVDSDSGFVLRFSGVGLLGWGWRMSPFRPY